ncbi:MAG: FHA domain-containing protein, partial [Mesorhizobium sp.]
MTAGSINNLWDAARMHPLLTNAFRSKGAAMGREMALKVTGGLHAGATLDLAEPLYTVGSSAESDIVLRDSGIASVHARLRRRGAKVEVEAVGGDVKLTNGEIVPKGHGRRCKLPLQIAFGEARVLLTGPEQTASGRGILRKPVLVAAGLVIVALFIAGNSLSLADAERINEGESIQKYAALDASHQGGLSPAAQHAASASEAGQQLGMRLAEAGIGTLTIAETNGRLVVSGPISHQQNDAWTGVR